MKLKVTTTITTLIDVDTLEPEHDVHVEIEPGLPPELARAAVVGACRSLLGELDEMNAER